MSVNSYKAIDDLAAGGLRGDDSAARLLLDIAWPVLLKRVIRTCWATHIQNFDTQNDVVQEVALDVWQCRRRYNGTSIREFNGWFYKISWARVCRAVDKKVKQRRTIPLLPTDPAEQDGARRLDGAPTELGMGGFAKDDPAGPALAAEEKVAIHECLERLGHEDSAAYDVLALRFFANNADPTRAKISEILGRPLGTVKEQYARGLQAIERCLKRKLK